jgi:uncharacterized protein (UPF0147 family)
LDVLHVVLHITAPRILVYPINSDYEEDTPLRASRDYLRCLHRIATRPNTPTFHQTLIVAVKQ